METQVKCVIFVLFYSAKAYILNIKSLKKNTEQNSKHATKHIKVNYLM